MIDGAVPPGLFVATNALGANFPPRPRAITAAVTVAGGTAMAPSYAPDGAAIGRG